MRKRLLLAASLSILAIMPALAAAHGPGPAHLNMGSSLAFASLCAMAPRWCIITTTRDGTCARSRRHAASAIMRRPGAGTGHRMIGGSTSIGAITSTGPGCAHPVPSISRMVMPSGGCMPPGTVEPLQPATISARQVRAPTRPRRSPSPPRLMTTCGVPRPSRERLPAGLVLWAGRRTTREPVGRQCRAAVRDLLNEQAIQAEQVMPDSANVDAGFAGVYARHIGEADAAKARVDDITCLFRWTPSRWHRSRPQTAPSRQAPDQLSCRLAFLSTSLAERSTRSRRSGISWLRTSSPSSRSAWSSSASGFFGPGQTIGLDFLALDKQRSRMAAGFKRPVGTRSHANPCCSKGFRHGIATSLLRLRAAVMIMPDELTSSRTLVTANGCPAEVAAMPAFSGMRHVRRQ